jgi:hypothetical protein
MPLSGQQGSPAGTPETEPEPNVHALGSDPSTREGKFDAKVLRVRGAARRGGSAGADRNLSLGSGPGFRGRRRQPVFSADIWNGAAMRRNTRWQKGGLDDRGHARDDVIAGVTCVVVNDTGFTNGKVTEKTSDYYAQDHRGNVWYYREDSFDLVKGEWVRSDGWWLAGVDGAQPGIIMEAHPESRRCLPAGVLDIDVDAKTATSKRRRAAASSRRVPTVREAPSARAAMTIADKAKIDFFFSLVMPSRRPGATASSRRRERH